ncbi:MAG: lamin tail domain-containing protein, partial [Cyclobacteriaceae bacterium]|nr:lamin tail domain-containing protein [Cyclobacteriaceae bacterium]
DISIIQMLSHDHLEIVFKKTPREDLAIEISNYAINQTQAISTINSDNIKDRRLILNLESSLTDKSVNTLMVQNLLDENENHISKTEYLFSFDSKYSGMRVINDNTLELEFEVGLDQEVLPDKLQFILAPDTSNPIAVFGDLEDNKILRLTFEDKFNSDIAYSIFWPQLVNEFGNQIPAFWVEFVKDETAPELVKIDVLSSKTIRLVFDESLDQNTTGIKSNYELSPNSGNIESVEYNEATTSIILIFSQSFINETDYTLLTKNIKDISGNLILPSNNNFTFIAPYIPKQGDLLFTEIMADPSPSKGLPDSEYIEIFNNSTEDILLNQVFLSDRTSKTKLSNDTLASQSYILLVPSASVELFPNSNITGVSNFPSLGNSEDSLTISLDDLTILDVVDYSDDWYRVNEKKAGGYSLERLIFGNKCLPSLNWIASDNSTGGTPGIENSLFNTEPDKTAPEIIEIAFISVNTLEIIFNEAMDFESLINGSYDFSAEFEIDQLIPSGDGRDILTIALNQNPKTGSLYNLLISEISDCAGNMMEPYTFIFGVGEKPKFNELLITEIMADPDPEVGQPQSEYLELYNASIKTLELSGLIIQDGNGTTELSSFALLPDTYLILAPSGGVGLFAEAEVLSVSGWRSLSNNGETISIYNGSELVFSVSYEKDWYKNGNKEEGGWSLEMIDVQNPCGGINNWTASEDISGGTPGRINSVVTNNPDNLGPQLIKAIAQDNQNIKLVFDEKLNPEQFSLGSLTIEPQIRISGFSTNEIILNEAYISLIDEIIPNETYTITATNFTDCVGNFIRNDNNSAVFVLAEVAIEGDVIINEVLFNPQSGGVDFVEVYNRSEKAINFQKWKLGNLNNANEIESDIISTEDLILLSGEFLVFTPDAVILKADYPISDETTFIKVSPFPTYSDADGTVILLDSLDNVIDLMKYESAYHFNLLDDVDGVSLERISFDGDSNDSNNWKSAASTSGFATPGLMNSQFKTNIQTSGILTIDPKVFVPDNTGVNDFTTINYQLQNAGNFANVNVYDAAGRLVKTIAQGDLLSTSGFFTWDGTDNSGSRARVGYYAIYFETFDSNGNKEMMKETVVLGIRF